MNGIVACRSGIGHRASLFDTGGRAVRKIFAGGVANIIEILSTDDERHVQIGDFRRAVCAGGTLFFVSSFILPPSFSPLISRLMSHDDNKLESARAEWWTGPASASGHQVR